MVRICGAGKGVTPSSGAAPAVQSLGTICYVAFLDCICGICNMKRFSRKISLFLFLLTAKQVGHTGINFGEYLCCIPTTVEQTASEPQNNYTAELIELLIWQIEQNLGDVGFTTIVEIVNYNLVIMFTFAGVGNLQASLTIENLGYGDYEWSEWVSVEAEHFFSQYDVNLAVVICNSFEIVTTAIWEADN